MPMQPVLRGLMTTYTHSLRCMSTASIPGLKILPNFLGKIQCKVIQDRAVELHAKILKDLEHAQPISCQTYLSKQHNLTSDEHYRSVRVEDDHAHIIKAQHFTTYGTDGHRLTYFIGNSNIPQFVTKWLITPVLQIPEVKFRENREPKVWKFTFNTYAKTKSAPSVLPGFDFHKDVASNGEVTMIYSIGAESTFQIRHPNTPSKVHSFPLISDSLLVLSDIARWDYEHCVTPVSIRTDSPLLDSREEMIYRISLVLGAGWR